MGMLEQNGWKQAAAVAAITQALVLIGQVEAKAAMACTSDPNILFDESMASSAQDCGTTITVAATRGVDPNMAFDESIAGGLPAVSHVTVAYVTTDDPNLAFDESAPGSHEWASTPDANIVLDESMANPYAPTIVVATPSLRPTHVAVSFGTDYGDANLAMDESVAGAPNIGRAVRRFASTDANILLDESLIGSQPDQQTSRMHVVAAD